jgi:hypothetical protein
MTTIQEVDIRLALARLRPASAYRWKVNGDTGFTFVQAVEWRDAAHLPPSEPELIAEWDIVLVERAAAAAAAVAAAADLEDVRAAQIQAALDQIQSDLTLLAGAPTNAQVLQIIGRALQRQSRIIKALRHLVE